MKIDFSLLVPQAWWSEDRWREYWESVANAIQGVLDDIGSLEKVYSLQFEDVVDEFLGKLAKNLGDVWLRHQDYGVNKELIASVRGFIKRKGAREFFDKIQQLCGIAVSWEDMGKKILILEAEREKRYVGEMMAFQKDAVQVDAFQTDVWIWGLDCLKYLQDGKYYRDGSIEVTVPIAVFPGFRELVEKFLAVGVYVWYVVIGGLQMTEVDVSLIGEDAATGVAVGVRSENSISEVVGDSSAESYETDSSAVGNVAWQYFSVDGELVAALYISEIVWVSAFQPDSFQADAFQVQV